MSDVPPLLRAALCRECDGTAIPTLHPETTLVDGGRRGTVVCPRCRDHPGVDPGVVHIQEDSEFGEDFSAVIIPLGADDA